MTMAAGTPVVMFIKKGAAGAIGHTFGVRVQRVRPAFGRLVQRKGRMHLIVYELLAPVVPALQPLILKNGALSKAPFCCRYLAISAGITFVSSLPEDFFTIL